jgi:lysophospholipase L1-like esterase
MPTMQRRRRYSWRSKLLLAVLGPAVILLALEAVLRLQMRRPVFVPDVRYIYRLDTGGAWQRKHATIDRAGYRGAEIVTPKPAGRFRILALGGSTTFGHGLRDDETWPFRLQGLLEKRGFPCEVINGGVPGWGAEHCLLRLEDDAGWIQPDLVLVYTGWNHPAVDPTRGFNPFPYGATLVRRLPCWLLDSRLFLWLAKKSSRLMHGDEDVFEGIERYDADLHLQLLEAGLRRLADWSRSHGTPLAVIHYPALVGATSDPKDAELYRATLMESNPRPTGELRDVFASNQKTYLQVQALLERVAKEQRLDLLDAASAIDKLGARERVACFLDRMHPSATGTQVIAESLADQIAARMVALGGAPAAERR